MPINARHKDQTVTQGIHIIHAFEYADEASRLAASYTSDDVGKVARQLDTNEFYIIKSTVPEFQLIGGISSVAGGDLDGYFPNPTVINLTITDEEQGSILYFDGSSWVQLAPGNDGYVLTTHSTGQDPTWSQGSGSGLPTGTAGGDLGGTYPNPTVNDLTIASEEQGSILYFDGSGWEQLAPGSDGYVLTTHDAGANPTWSEVIGSGGSPTGSAGGDLSGTYPNPTVSDLTIASEEQGSILYFDGSGWEQLAPADDGYVLKTHSTGQDPTWEPETDNFTGATAGGDLSGTYPNPTVSDLTIASEEQGSILYFDGSGWEQLAPADDGYVLTTHDTGANPTWSQISSTSPVGPAGGDLGGSYPNPTVSDLTIASEEQGSLLYFNGSNWAQLAPGNDGYVLKTHGTGANPEWLPDNTGDAGGSESLSETLAIGNITDGYDIVISTGDAINFLDEIDIQKNNVTILSTTSDGYVILSDSLGGNVIVVNDTSVTINTDTTIDGYLTVTGKLNVAGLIDPTGLVLDKQTSVPGGTPESGKSTLWIRNDDTLMFTDSLGADNDVAAGSAGGDLGGTYPNPTVNDLTIAGEEQGSILYFDGSGWEQLAPGADGYVLMTHDTGANPTWESETDNFTNATAGGDLSGTYPNPTVRDLTIASEEQGSILYFDGSGWEQLAPADDGYVLTTHNTGANPTWSQISSGSTTPIGPAGGDLSGSYPNPTVRDLTIASEEQGSILYFDGSGWEQLSPADDGYVLKTHSTGQDPTWEPETDNFNGASAGGDLSGTYPNPTVSDLTIASEEQGSLLYFNGSNWVQLAPAADGYVLTTHDTGANPTWEEISDGTPSGAAGGDLSGTYPNPQVSDLTIASEEQGSILYFDGSGWEQLAPGQDGYVLTTHDTGANPTWTLVSSGSSSPIGAAGGDLGGSYPNPEVNDLTITNEEQGSLLYFNGSTWVQLAPADDGYVLKTHSTGQDPTWEPETDNFNGVSAGGDLSGTYPNPTVSDLTIASEEQGSILYFDGSGWEQLSPADDGYVLKTHSTGQNPTWGPETDNFNGASAGGDLSGTYPNPTVNDLTIAGEEQGSILYFDGSGWEQLSPADDGYVLKTHSTGQDPTWEPETDNFNGASAGGDLSGTYPNPTVSDLTIASEEQGSILYFDGSGWEQLAPADDGYVLKTHSTGQNPTWEPETDNFNGASAGGDLSGTYPNPTVSDLTIASEEQGSILYFDGSGWEQLAPGADGYVLTTHDTGANPTWEETTGGGSPSGAAGGDLSGTYPNPTVSDLTIASEEQGSILYFDGSGWEQLAPGDDGYILTTHGIGVNPEWLPGNSGNGGGESLSETLFIGNLTDGYDIVISTGDAINFLNEIDIQKNSTTLLSTTPDGYVNIGDTANDIVINIDDTPTVTISADTIITGEFTVSSIQPFNADGYDNILYPEYTTGSASTITIATTFQGGTYYTNKILEFNFVTMRISTVNSGGGRLVGAIYQSTNGLSNQPMDLIATFEEIPISSSNTNIVVATSATATISPGIFAIVVGRTSADGGDFDYASWANSSVPLITTNLEAATYRPCFTTAISVTTSPPSTIDLTSVTAATTAVLPIIRVLSM